MTAWALSPRLIEFIQLLRRERMQVGSGETQDALQALTCAPLGNAESFRLALRTVLAKSREDQIIFDRLFAQFWLRSEPAYTQVEDAAETGDDDANDELAPGGVGKTQQPAAGEAAEHRESPGSGATPQARLSQTDFAHIDAAEIDEMRALIDLIGKRLAHRAGRRWRRASRGAPDLRRSMRRAMASGGELIEIKRRRRRPQRLNLVVLADVSHSMDSYSRFFLQFVYAFQSLFRSMETFVFSTRLSRVTDALRRGRLSQALDALPDVVDDWAGGTRIGASLQAFTRDFGDRLLGRHTVVMIVSDGWDTGGQAELDQALKTLRERCKMIIWLDPLQDHPRYFASAAGMHTGSRWVDHCLPARDLQSLRALARELERVG